MTASARRSPTRAQTPTQNFVNDLSWFKGASHDEGRAPTSASRACRKNRFQAVLPHRHRQPVVGGGRRPPQHAGQLRSAPFPAAACRRGRHGFQAGYADAWLNILGVLSQATQRANYNTDGTPQAPGTAVAREIASDEYEWYVQDAWQLRPNLTDHRRRALQPLLAALRSERPVRSRRRSAWAQWFDQRVENMNERHSVERQPDRARSTSPGPKNDKPGFYAWDKNNFAPRVAVAWTPKERLVVRGGYSKVFDRVGVGLATNFDEGFAFGMSTQISSPFGARL